MHTSNESRVAVITGGSSGIGRSTARYFARHGWRVALVARGAEALEAARADLASKGATVAVFQADVSDAQALQAAAAEATAELGPVGVWVNNAAVGAFARFMDMTDAEFRRVTEVDYFGCVNGTRVALELMRPRNVGSIINVCSAIGLRGTPLQSAYSGAKWAMRGFAEAVRAELVNEGSNVHVGTVYPPAVNTPFYSHALSRIDGVPRPPPPVYQPELIAEAIYLAATQRRRDQLVGGQTVALALLNGLAPSLTDRLIGAFGPKLQSSSNKGVAAARDENVFAPSTREGPEHGAFDAESLSTSAQLWASKHRGVTASLAALGTLAVGLMIMGQPRRD